MLLIMDYYCKNWGEGEITSELSRSTFPESHPLKLELILFLWDIYIAFMQLGKTVLLDPQKHLWGTIRNAIGSHSSGSTSTQPMNIPKSKNTSGCLLLLMHMRYASFYIWQTVWKKHSAYETWQLQWTWSLQQRIWKQQINLFTINPDPIPAFS